MTDKFWNVASYARLSGEDGDKAESNSITSQKEMIRDFISKYNNMAIVREYVDDGFSGVNFERPGFKMMMEDIKKKKINCIVCKDLSRFGRNYVDAGRYLEKIFPFMGVRFIAINDNYDSDGEKSQQDSLIIPFKNLINDSYCRDISVKIRSQLDIKRKMGDFIGAFATYGYKKDCANKNKLVVDDEAARIVEYIFNQRIDGMCNSRIAEKLNSMGVPCPMEYKRKNGMRYHTGFRTNDRAYWTPVSIMRILTNEVYIGTLCQHKRGTPNHKIKRILDYDRSDWIIIENNHEPIIDKKDFETVQLLLKRDVRTAPKSDNVPLFSGFVFCGDCGCNMVRKTVPSGDKKYHYLVCSNNKANRVCSPHSFSEDKLTKIVFQLVTDHIDNISRMDEVLEYINKLPEKQRRVFNYEAQITKLESEIQRFKDLKLNLYSDLADGVISREEYMEFGAGYDRRIAERQRSLAVISDERQQAIDTGNSQNDWIKAFREYENITELHRGVIVNLIEKIIIYDSKHIEVKFRYQDRFETALQYIESFKDSDLNKEGKLWAEQDDMKALA